MSETKEREWAGIFAAIPTPFTSSLALDFDQLSNYLEWLLAHESVDGVVCGAHAGEVTNLTNGEIVELAAACASIVRGRAKVVAAHLAEGVVPAQKLARELTTTGVDALLVMPPHHWLRFGKTPVESASYVEGVAAATALPLIIHEYPWDTKARYTPGEVAHFARIPNVKAIKSGTRNLTAYAQNIAAVRAADSTVSILTCHDEALLGTMIQDVDGALVAIGALLPDEVAGIFTAARSGDLNAARSIERRIAPITDVFYGTGEVGGHAHALLKAGLNVIGVLENRVMRPPIESIEGEELERVRHAVESSGLPAVASL